MEVTPAGHGARGAAFVTATLAEVELTDSGLALLHEVARTLDRIDDLEAVVAREGSTVKGSTGQTVVHPAIPEARQQRATLARLLHALDLDGAEDEEEDAGGARIYSVNTDRAQYAATERWRRAR